MLKYRNGQGNCFRRVIQSDETRRIFRNTHKESKERVTGTSSTEYVVVRGSFWT
jgi:hypothetical protein